MVKTYNMCGIMNLNQN